MTAGFSAPALADYQRLGSVDVGFHMDKDTQWTRFGGGMEGLKAANVTIIEASPEFVADVRKRTDSLVQDWIKSANAMPGGLNSAPRSFSTI